MSTSLCLLGKLSTLIDRYPDLQEPWSVPQLEESIEEQETEIPCSFTGPLYYLSKPYEEVLEEYREMFTDHISEDWKQNTEIYELLMSKEALGVFVPKE